MLQHLRPYKLDLVSQIGELEKAVFKQHLKLKVSFAVLYATCFFSVLCIWLSFFCLISLVICALSIFHPQAGWAFTFSCHEKVNKKSPLHPNWLKSGLVR